MPPPTMIRSFMTVLTNDPVERLRVDSDVHRRSRRRSALAWVRRFLSERRRSTLPRVGPRLAARARNHQRPFDEEPHLLSSVVEVGALVPGSLARDEHVAVGVEGRGGAQAMPGGCVEPLDAIDVDPQLDLARDLVHVLAARTARRARRAP